MKKISILTTIIILAASSVAFSSTTVSGDWCQSSYDDFNTVMTISENGDIQRSLVGVRDGESGPIERGFISVGASNVEMQLSGQSLSVYNVEVKTHWLTGKETLHIDYNDRNDEIFSRCNITWSKITR